MAFHEVELSNAKALNLRYTLPSGQCFRWKQLSDDTWRGVIGEHVVTLRQKDVAKNFEFSTFPESDPVVFSARLADYFRLDSTDLEALFVQWSTPSQKKLNGHDINEDFASAAVERRGLRLIRQQPFECTFSFICSQNNNISRISGMIDRLCKTYGTRIATVEDVEYFAFPTLEQLVKATETELSELGFGYRAKYIVGSAKLVSSNGGENWLNGLREVPREAAKVSLLSLPGVGPKVADCISLFSLDHLDVVPVDTHVWQMATKYMPSMASVSSPSPKLFGEIGAFFIEKFGSKAGWAHTVLFSAAIMKKSSSSPSSSRGSDRKVSAKKRKKEESDDEDVDYVPANSKRVSRSEL